MTDAAETSQSAPAETRRAASDAAARGLTVEFVVRDGTGRPTNADFGGAQIVKSVVVQRGDSFVFVLTPLDGQFSWAKLRAHLGVNRLSLPDADAAYAATGYKRGTITPLGSSTAWPVIVDEGLRGQTVVVGAGSPGIGALVDADALVEAYGADTVQLTGAQTE